MKNNLLYLFVLAVSVNPFIASHDLRVEKQPTQRLKDSAAAFALAFGTSFVTTAVGKKLTPYSRQNRAGDANPTTIFRTPDGSSILSIKDEGGYHQESHPLAPVADLVGFVSGNVGCFTKIKYLDTKHPVFSGIFGFLGSVIGACAAAIFIQRPVKQI